MEYVKCTNCKGTGHVGISSHAKGLSKCPICKGTGKKPVKKPEIRRKG